MKKGEDENEQNYKKQEKCTSYKIINLYKNLKKKCSEIILFTKNKELIQFSREITHFKNLFFLEDSYLIFQCFMSLR